MEYESDEDVLDESTIIEDEPEDFEEELRKERERLLDEEEFSLLPLKVDDQLDFGKSFHDVARAAAFNQKNEENARTMEMNYLTVEKYLLMSRIDKIAVKRIMNKFEIKIRRLNYPTLTNVIKLSSIKNRTITEVRYFRFLEYLKAEALKNG